MRLREGATHRLPGRFDLKGIALILLAGVAFFDGTRLSEVMSRKINIDAVGPHGYLVFLGGLMLLLGAILLVQGVRARPQNADGEVPWSILAAVFGLFMAYAFGVEIVGFTLASFMFLILITRLLSQRTWLWSGAFSAATTAGLYLAFVQLSDMALPRGLWGA